MCVFFSVQIAQQALWLFHRVKLEICLFLIIIKIQLNAQIYKNWVDKKSEYCQKIENKKEHRSTIQK